MTHYLFDGADEFVRCGEYIPDDRLCEQTTNDFLMVTCPLCTRLLIEDAKPPALRKEPT